MTDLSKARLGAYDHERGVRTLYVPCGPDEDPRQAKPKPKAKRKVPRTPKPKGGEK